jgi:hypothetical protein
MSLRQILAGVAKRAAKRPDWARSDYAKQELARLKKLVKDGRTNRVRVRRPTSKRKHCAHCKRYRARKFIEWHPGIFEWQCSDFGSCDAEIERRWKIQTSKR